MPAKSASAEPTRSAWTLPRWIFEVWLWVNAAASLFAWYACDPSGAGNWCSPAAPLFEFAFRLFPMTLQVGFPAATPQWAVIAVLLALTVVTHGAIRRFIPVRLRLWQFAALWLGWWLLSLLAFGLGVGAQWAWSELRL